jgi:hypothetical protein
LAARVDSSHWKVAAASSGLSMVTRPSGAVGALQRSYDMGCRAENQSKMLKTTIDSNS